MPRTFTRSLSAAASIGVLTLGLTACGGNGDGGESASPTPEQTSPAATSAAPSATESASPTESTSESAPASQSASASGAEQIEQAIQTVMGEDADILTSAQLRQANEQMQGLTENVTITPAECGTDQSGMSFPEDAEMIGGVITDTTDPAAPSSQVLSMVTFTDAAQGQELLDQARDFAQTCSTFTVEMGQGLKATSEVTLEEVTAEDADDALAHTSTIEVEMEEATLPPGATQSTTTTVYVLKDDTLYQYVHAGQADSAEVLTEGQTTIAELRAELGR